MDSSEEILMIMRWEEKGCLVCRKLCESGSHPPEIAINYDLHSRLHTSTACGAYWKQLERYADVIDESEAQANYSEGFIEKDKKMTEKLISMSHLEKLLIEIQSGNGDFLKFIKFFPDADAFVPSATEIMQDGAGFEPLLFDKKGTQMLGVFTSVGRVNLFKNMTHFCLSMKGRDLFSRTPSDFGLVINPGFDKGFEIYPTGLKTILRELGA